MSSVFKCPAGACVAVNHAHTVLTVPSVADKDAYCIVKS